MRNEEPGRCESSAFILNLCVDALVSGGGSTHIIVRLARNFKKICEGNFASYASDKVEPAVKANVSANAPKRDEAAPSL